MLAKDKHRIVTRLAYFDHKGVRRMVRELGVALADGRVRLVHRDNGVYLIITPKTLWVSEEEQELQVQSNTNWIIL